MIQRVRQKSTVTVNLHCIIYRVGQIKPLNGANAVSFVVMQHVFREFLAGEITVHLRALRSIKIKYFSPEGATKSNDFLYCSILTVLLNHSYYIKKNLLTSNF